MRRSGHRTAAPLHLRSPCDRHPTPREAEPTQKPHQPRRPHLRWTRADRRRHRSCWRWRRLHLPRDRGLEPASTPPRRPTGRPPTSSATSGRWSRHDPRGGHRRWSMAVPFAIGIALFITHYAPRRVASTVRLRRRPARRGALARLRPVGRRFLAKILHRLHGWIAEQPAASSVLPAAARPNRPHAAHRRRRARHHDPADHHGDLARGVPPGARDHDEAALALGATRWEMIRTR